RDKLVTGVQTCALPICECQVSVRPRLPSLTPLASAADTHLTLTYSPTNTKNDGRESHTSLNPDTKTSMFSELFDRKLRLTFEARSEERRVGKAYENACG